MIDAVPAAMATAAWTRNVQVKPFADMCAAKLWLWLWLWLGTSFAQTVCSEDGARACAGSRMRPSALHACDRRDAAALRRTSMLILGCGSDDSTPLALAVSKHIHAECNTIALSTSLLEMPAPL